MLKFLKWCFEPFTIPQYKITMADAFKATIVVLVICGLIIGLLTLVYFIYLKITRRI